MPLRALQNGTNIFAFEQDEASWTILKTNYKSSSLLMPCCQSAAIPKRSRLGNFFFAHSIQGDCDSEPESQEHIWIKSLVAKAAIKAGWNVKTEWPGESNDAEKWIADVYCTKGAAKIALEIQLSRQTAEETRARQLKYKKSGVRCAWFASERSFNYQYIRQRKDLPFFIISSPKVGIEPTLIEFPTSLTDFVIGMLNKKLNWVIEERPEEYAIDYIEDTCWKCKKENKQVYGYSINVYGSHAVTIPNASDTLEKITDIINNEELKELGLNTIGKFEMFKGKIMNYPYCNVCVHCGAPQNNFYLLQKLNSNIEGENKSSAKYIKKTKTQGQWVYIT